LCNNEIYFFQSSDLRGEKITFRTDEEYQYLIKVILTEHTEQDFFIGINTGCVDQFVFKIKSL